VKYILNQSYIDKQDPKKFLPIAKKMKKRHYYFDSQSKQTLFSLLVQYCLLHTVQVVFLIKPLSAFFACMDEVFLDGKLMALLWQSGSHAEQPLMHLVGLATTAFSSLKA
jgi:hypothetical protein